MASGGHEIDSYNGTSSTNHPPPPSLTRNVSYGQEVSGSWMNLSESFEHQESKLPRRVSAIMATMKLKLAVLSGGRDNEGRVIITFPARPRGTQYDHTQLLQTIQYLSIVPSTEACELGFVLIIDGRLLPWSDTKMILRTSQEALPGQIHIAYIIQPTQFVNKQQMSMGLSKEKDKIEYTIVKVSSVEKIVRHIDQRQVTFDLSGLLAYNHDEWLKLRAITEELLDAYQNYLVTSSHIENRLKSLSAMSPERTSELQNEMSQLEDAKTEINSADEKVKELCVLLRNEVESNSGSIGMTPEMVNCVATVDRISRNTEQHQNMLKDMQEQNYHRLKEIFSLKQFELGLAKVNQWIKNKGMNKVLRVDIGDSIPKVLTIQDDLKKLQGKAEAVANDVIELRRISDIMSASEHYAKDSVKERLKKVNVKYMKFKTALERRKTIVTTSVAMYKGINEWRQAYDDYTGKWTDVVPISNVDEAKELLLSLETQHSSLKEMAQKTLTQGQELVKCLKNSPVAQGDPDFRKSLRFISRVTEEVTEKLRKCHELAAVRRAKLDQYVQLLVCEKDAHEAITNLQHMQEILLMNYGGIGTSVETLSSIVVEVEQHEDEVKRNHEYGRRLLHVARQQREQLNDKDTNSQTLLTELDNVCSSTSSILREIKWRLDLAKKLFSVYESTQVTAKQTASLNSSNGLFGKEAAEGRHLEVLSSLTLCKSMVVELRNRLKEPLPSSSNDTSHNSSVIESIKALDHLLISIENQGSVLAADSEETDSSQAIEGRLISMEQIIEDILIWLREYGLSQFTEFLSLGFTLTTVQDQWNEFCAFRETCQGLTKQVDDLEKSATEVAHQQPSGSDEIAKTNKRVKDLNRVWRKFLIRVQNREVVLSSLQQFLHGSVTLASMMSEALKLGQFHENLPVFKSAYHSTIQQGNSLVSLLKDSPDGTHDSQIVDRVSDRMKQLTNLHHQCRPLVMSEGGSTVSTSSSENITTSKTDEVGVSPMSENARSNFDFETESDEVFMVNLSGRESSGEKSAKQQFNETEKAVTVLHEELLISLGEFFQHHDVFPPSLDKIEVELKAHEAFLELKRTELEQLSNKASLMKSQAVQASVPNIQLQYLFNQIKKKLPDKVSILEKRIRALESFSALSNLKTECFNVNEDIELFLATSKREKVTPKNLQDILKTCSALEKRVQELTITCSELIHEFTELCSETGMRAIEAKKHLRMIRQEIDNSAYRFTHSLKRRRKELEANLKADDIETKLMELIAWVGDDGVPSMTTITSCNNSNEAEKALQDLKQLGSRGEVVDNEIKAIAGAVQSIDSSDLINLLRALEIVYAEWKTSFKSKLEALNATVEFFVAAETLREELESATSGDGISSQQTLNPSVIEKLYTVLRKQAENVQAMGPAIDSPTISSINEHLKQVEDLVNGYLQLQSPTNQDISFEYSMLDDFLLDIQKEVQDVIDSVTVVETPVEEMTPKSVSKDNENAASSKRPPVNDRKPGTVRNLKKLFESGNSADTGQPPLPPKKTNPSLSSFVHLDEDWSMTVNTYPPKRRLSSSSTVIKESPSKLVPESPLEKSFQAEKVSSVEETTLVKNDPPPSLPSSSDPSIVIVKTKEAPIHSTITINIQSIASAPTTPTPQRQLSPKSEDVPNHPSPPPEVSDMDNDNYQTTPPPIGLSQEQATPPPIRLPLSQEQSTPPPIRPPLPLSQEQYTPPPIRPPPPLSQEQYTPPPIRPPPPLSQDQATPSPIRPPLPLSQQFTPPPIRPPLPLSGDESSQEFFPLLKPNHITPINSNINSQESVEDYSSTNPESLHGSNLSENSQGDVSSLSHTPQPTSPVPTSVSQQIVNEDDMTESFYNEYLSIPDTYGEDMVPNGYYEQHLSELRMEESTRPRDLSPVLEETTDEDELNKDNPDWGSRNKKKKNNPDKKNMELSRAHKQSLLSMKAVIRNFYEDEVQYSNSIFRLIEVFAPILQHTGIFDAVYPIAEFQREFLAKLNQSMATIPELCACFQQNLENFKLYFPFVLGYDRALHIITSINPDELAAALQPNDVKISESDLIIEYTAPYHRLEIYCSLFQQLLRAAFKEDLMNLEALSETLESLLDHLRILAMELATTKLNGCPFPVQATDVLAMNPFLVHLANKVKDVFLYTVFLHPQALVITERHLDDSKEHTLYTYIMHISISGMVLVENFRGLSDRFAVCEKGQIATENFVVFRSCDDISVKDFWVAQIKMLLQKESEELTPRETLLPEQVEEIGHMIPNSVPPRSSADISKRLEPLKKRKSFKKQKKIMSADQGDSIDGFQTPESPVMENVHQVIMDHRISDGPLANEYLAIKEGDLVEVLQMNGNNYYCMKFPIDSDEEGEEGYIPACCVRPLPFRITLNNHNSNNNIHEERGESLEHSMESTPKSLDHFHRPTPSSNEGIKRECNLEEEWSEFCSRTGRSEPFPDCTSEQELLNAKLDSLVKYYSNQHMQNDPRQLEMDRVGIDTTDEGRFPNERSDTAHESARRHLYSAPFLGYTADEEPSYAQLNGVFSLKHPYASKEEIVSDNEYQLELRKGQLVAILDSKREDWWLVSTFTEGDCSKQEGWVKRDLLQHAEYIREDVTESSNHRSAFSIQLWLTLAQYSASDEGTISVNEGELVEVIDNSRNKWSLVKTIGRQPREGWIPTEYIVPYNFSDNDFPTSPLSPGVSIHPSIRVDDSMSSAEGNYDFLPIVSPTLSLGELDSEEKRREALAKRECTLMELYASEKEYVDRLEYCITNYKRPIQSANSNAPKLLKALAHELFTNIEEIHSFHKEEMLPRIESSQRNPAALVDLFSFANLHLKNLYVIYCKGQQKSESIIRDFTEYIKELSNKLKDRLSLRDYLILPIQRITKYNLLLKNVHDYSIKSGYPIPHFQATLGAAQEVSRQANNSVHMSMIEVPQKKLAEFGKLVLQEEFEFADQTTAKGQFKRRQVFLFEKCLVIAKSRKESPERESYVIRETFILSEISLGEDHDSTTKNIVIYEMVSGNKIILKAHSLKAHEEWLKMANELASLSKKLFMASTIMQQGSGGNRSRSLSEPLDMLPVYPTALLPISNSPSTLLSRQGSQRLRRSAKSMNRPQSAAAAKAENFEPGTIFVVMEKIIPQQGVEDFELEPGEEVELIKSEPNGLLTICTTDENRLIGSVPSAYLRHRDLVTDNLNTAPKVTRHLTDLTQYLYDNILISCAFNGFPEPSIEWVKKGGETVMNSDRVKISSCPTSSVLEIRDLQYSDEGEYICHVSNELGEDKTSMDLYIEGPPVPPSKPIASKITHSSVRLKWNPPDHDGHSIITYYTVELLREGFGEWQPIVQQPKTTFVVKTLNPNTWYQFRVIACNDNGESRASEPSDIISTSKGKGSSFISPAPKRKLIVDVESKGSEEVDHGVTETGQYLSASFEDLTSARTSPGSLPDTPSHGYHMIRQSSVGSVYDLGDELGRGRYGIIYKCINKTNSNIHCAKYLNQTELAKSEVKILHGLCRGQMCDNLVQWVDAIQTDTNIVIVMECIEGGEMIDVILKIDCLTEAAIVSYLKQLLKALDYIHEKKIIHCDIKPENIMLTGEDCSTLKLIDFGSAHTDQSQSTLPIATLAHSLEFCAPEIINKHTVTTFADMWSVGVLTYILLSGMSPFFVENTEVLIQKVVEISYDINHSDFQQVSPEAKDFVAMLLKRNPTQRLSAQNGLQHSWIKTLGEAYGRCSTWPGPGIDLDKLKLFHTRRKLQTSSIATKTSNIFRSHTPSLSPTHLSTDVSYGSPDILESRPILEEGTKEVQTPINADIRLEWLFTGHPTPSIVWEYKERKVVPSGRVRVTTENGISQLYINRVVKADEGVYTCFALNSLGCDIQECSVIVLDKPSAPYGITGVLLESTSAMVSWSKPLCSGNSIVTHYILEMRRMEYDQWELVDDEIQGMAHVINGLLPGAVYVFRVAAVNYIGVSESSKPSAPIHIHDEEGMRSNSPYMLNEASMNKTDVELKYNIHNEIGRGAYSIVYECTEKSTDRVYAAKCIPKELEQHALSEFECLRRLNHPRIVELEEVFDMPSQTVLILEYVSDGELSCFVTPSAPLDETRAARFTRHITEGLQYLHDLGFIHANLTPRHLLLSAGKTDIKIAGFSCAREEHNYGMYSEEVPVSPEYHAPESIESQRLTCDTDMWSLGGVILFMLTGHPPFHASNLQKLVADINSVSINSDCNTRLTSLSDDCYDLVFKGLLIVNPRKRLSSHQCQRHRWLQNIGIDSKMESMESNDTPPPVAGRHSLKHMNTEEQVQYFLTNYHLPYSSPNSNR